MNPETESQRLSRKPVFPFSKFSNAAILGGLVFFLGIGIYFGIVLSNTPRAVQSILTFLLQPDFRRLVFYLLLFAGSYVLRGDAGRVLRFILTLSLFGCFLRGYWVTHYSRHYLLLGILPWTDSYGYLIHSERLLAGFDIDVSRPEFSVLYSALLWITGHNQLFANTLVVLLASFSIYLLCEQIRDDHGPIVAAAGMLISFYYYRHYLGSISTESLGFIFGCLGLTLFFKSLRKPSPAVFGFGIFLLMLGVISRAGPILAVLFACLVLFAVQKPFRRRRDIFFASAAGTAGGFLVNSLLMKSFVSKTVVPFGNFLFSLYGLASGGGGWSAIWDTHPEVAALPDPQRSQMILTMTLDLIKKNPLDLLRAAGSQFGLFFNYSDYSIYSFLYTDHPAADYLIMAVLAVFVIAGLVVCIKRIKNPAMCAVLAMFAGMFLSIPMLTPQDTTFMRPYAALIPLFGFLPGLGLQGLVQVIFHRNPAQENPPAVHSPANAAWGVSGLVLALLALPFIVRAEQPARVLSLAECPGGETAFLYPYLAQNVLNITVDPSDGPNGVSFADFKRSYHDITYTIDEGLFRDIQPGDVMFAGVDPQTGNDGWFIGKTEMFQPGNGSYRLCVSQMTDPNSQFGGYYRVDQAQKMK
jgi:hypothetical protein